MPLKSSKAGAAKSRPAAEPRTAKSSRAVPSPKRSLAAKRRAAARKVKVAKDKTQGAEVGTSLPDAVGGVEEGMASTPADGGAAEAVTSKTKRSASGAAASKKQVEKPTRKKLTPKPSGLLKLAYGTIEKELGKLERQKGDKSQDRERASRALSQIINSFGKAYEMERQIKKDSKENGQGKKDKDVLKDAEAKRRELAERIARFRASRAL